MSAVAYKGIQAIHEEHDFFAHVEQEQSNVRAVLALADAAHAATKVKDKAKKTGKHDVFVNATRVLRRIRDEMHYRKEILSHALFKEGLVLFWGFERLNEIYAHHFQQIEIQRKAWNFTVEQGGAINPSRDIVAMHRYGHIKCLTDEQMFLTTIRATPDLLEATDLCRRALQDLRRVHLEATANGDLRLLKQCESTADRVKDDLHVLCQINQNSSINYSIRVLLEKEDRLALYGWLNSQPEYELVDRLQHQCFNRKDLD